MENINFQPIFDYIDQTKNELIQVMDEKFATKKDVEVLQKNMESFAKEVKDWRDEKHAIDHRLERYDKWFKIVAEKLNIRLPA